MARCWASVAPGGRAAARLPPPGPAFPQPCAASAGNAEREAGAGPSRLAGSASARPPVGPGAPRRVRSVGLAPCWAAFQNWRNVLSLRLGEQPEASPAPGLMVSSSKSPQIF